MLCVAANRRNRKLKKCVFFFLAGVGRNCEKVFCVKILCVVSDLFPYGTIVAKDPSSLPFHDQVDRPRYEFGSTHYGKSGDHVQPCTFFTREIFKNIFLIRDRKIKHKEWTQKDGILGTQLQFRKREKRQECVIQEIQRILTWPSSCWVDQLVRPFQRWHRCASCAS